MAAPPKPPEAPPPEPPPTKPVGPDSVESRKKVDLNRAYGAQASSAPGQKLTTFSVQAPTETGPQIAQKNAERLRILVRSPTYQNAEKFFLDRLEPRLRVGVSLAARRIGSGPWKKRFDSPAALVTALQENFAPLLQRDLGVTLPAFTPAADDLFLATWPDLPGEPPLHPDYLGDANAYGLRVFQEEVKHVAHTFVMAAGHGFVRAILADKRTRPEADVAAAHGITAEQLYVFEANLCQYYVPESLAAYFENQPMRLFARELANRFRKVAFGGQ